MAHLTIRPGSAADERALLALFDEAVAWMVARGQEGQWGDRPFSERPEPAGACASSRRATGCGSPSATASPSAR